VRRPNNTSVHSWLWAMLQLNKIGQCDMGTGCIATPGSRPTQTHSSAAYYCSTVFARWSGANEHAHLTRNSFTYRQLDRFSRFCMADAIFSVYDIFVTSHTPQRKNCPILGICYTHLINGSLNPHHPPLHIDRVDLFSQYMFVTNG